MTIKAQTRPPFLYRAVAPPSALADVVAVLLGSRPVSEGRRQWLAEQVDAHRRDVELDLWEKNTNDA